MMDYEALTLALAALFAVFLLVALVAGRRRPKKIKADPNPWYCEYARGPGEEV